MAGRSQEDVDGLTASELLKSAFQNAEKVLASREDKFKKEIEGKKKENELLQRKLQIEVSEKLRLEKECVELKELACRLREELGGLHNKLKENEVDQNEIIELKGKICDLECEKLRIKTDVDINQRRFKKLELRVLSLEKRDFEKDASMNLTTAKTNAAAEKCEALLETNTNPSDGSSYGERTEDIVGSIESDYEWSFLNFFDDL